MSHEKVPPEKGQIQRSKPKQTGPASVRKSVQMMETVVRFDEGNSLLFEAAWSLLERNVERGPRFARVMMAINQHFGGSIRSTEPERVGKVYVPL